MAGELTLDLTAVRGRGFVGAAHHPQSWPTTRRLEELRRATLDVTPDRLGDRPTFQQARRHPSGGEQFAALGLGYHLPRLNHLDDARLHPDVSDEAATHQATV